MTDILMTAPMAPAVIAALEHDFTLHRLWEQDDRATFLQRVGAAVRGVATGSGFGRVDDALFAALPALEIVASLGVGYDGIDAAAAARRGVVVTNTPDVPAALLDLANVVVLPHVGSASVATRAAMGRLVVDNLAAWFAQGRALTPVAETRHLSPRNRGAQ